MTLSVKIVLVLLASVLLAGCTGDPPPPTPVAAFDLSPFQEAAENALCADLQNDLYLIDGKLVVWDMAGSCSDASYSQILYGSTPEERLCIFHDSIAGPMKECDDEEYRQLFETIIANSDQPDLGLGDEHTVEVIPH